MVLTPPHVAPSYEQVSPPRDGEALAREEEDVAASFLPAAEKAAAVRAAAERKAAQAEQAAAAARVVAEKQAAAQRVAERAAEKAATERAAVEKAAARKAAAAKTAAAKAPAPARAPSPVSGGGDGGGGYAAGGGLDADAALQALAAGERALRSGDPTKAVRLLEKATRFAGEGGEVASRIAAARKEAQAILKEQMAERADSAAGGDSPPPPPPRPHAAETPSAAAAAAEAAAEEAAPRRSAADAVKAAALRLFTAWLLPLLLACFTRPWGLLASIGGGVKLRVEERWAAFLDPETHERLSYVFYYWRARFRTPLRLLLVLVVLLLAWRHPWKANAACCMCRLWWRCHASAHCPGLLVGPLPGSRLRHSQSGRDPLRHSGPIVGCGAAMRPGRGRSPNSG